MTETRNCSQGCDRAGVKRGLCDTCYRRWLRAGRPDEVPPALSPSDRATLRWERRRAQSAAEIAEREWLAGEGDRRIRRSASVADALIRCTRAGDAAGIRLLYHRADLPALMVVLAARAAEAEDALRELADAERQTA